LNKKKKPAWDEVRTILNQNEKGRALIVLGVFLIITGGTIEILVPITVIGGKSTISIGGILVMLGVLVFLLGIVIYILEDRPRLLDEIDDS